MPSKSIALYALNDFQFEPLQLHRPVVYLSNLHDFDSGHHAFLIISAYDEKALIEFSSTIREFRNMHISTPVFALLKTVHNSCLPFSSGVDDYINISTGSNISDCITHAECRFRSTSGPIGNEAPLKELIRYNPYAYIMIDRRHAILDFNITAGQWAIEVFSKNLFRGAMIDGFLSDDFVSILDNCFSRQDCPGRGGLEIVEGPDGNERWYEYAFTPLMEEDRIERIWITIADVTERKITIDQTLQKEMQYKKMVRDSHDLIVLLGEDGIIRYVSESLEKMLGFKKEDLLGTVYFDIIHDVNRKNLENMFHKAASSEGSTFRMEYQLAHRDGYYIYTETIASNMLNDEHVRAFILTSRDITQRKEMEEVLNRINRQRELILESTADAVFGINREGIITFINPAALDLLRTPESEAIGKHYSEITNPGIPLSKNEPVARVLRTGDELHNIEGVLHRKNGKNFHAEYSVVPLRSKDELTGAVITMRDISRRIQTEQTLIDAKKAAEEASEAKSSFLANMSHEIRTPLNSIIGFVDLISRTSLTTEQRNYLDTVRDSSEHLSHIINDILDLSKIEEQKLELEKIPFDPLVLFSRTLKFFSADSQTRNIQLISYIDPLIPETVFGDPLRLQQVLINLVGNALKFTETGGRIVVSIVMTNPCDESLSLRFIIADNGIGIPESQKERIFDSFKQADSSITRKFGGTGLGLTISSRIISLMGGELQFESVENEGTTFFFDLTLKCAGKNRSFPNFHYSHVAILVPAKNTFSDILAGYFSRIKKKVSINPDSLDTVDLVCIDESIDLFPENYTGSVYLFGELPIEEVDPQRVRRIDKPVTPLDLFIQEQESSVNQFQTFDGLKLLLAEDNPNNQKLMKEFFTRLGINWKIVPDGLQAVESAREEPWDIILMDIQMPVMDGYEAVRLIREEGFTGSIIALSAKGGKKEKDSYREKGFNQYILKPVNLEKLQQALEKHAPAGGPSRNWDIKNVAAELGLDEETVRELLMDVLSSLDTYIAPLNEAVNDGNLKAIEFNAHKLKGTLGSYQLTWITELLAEMEDSAEVDMKDYPYGEIFSRALQYIDEIRSIISL